MASMLILEEDLADSGNAGCSKLTTWPENVGSSRA